MILKLDAKKETVKLQLDSIKLVCPEISKEDLNYLELCLGCVYSSAALNTFVDVYERAHGKKVK
jgi:hypothetical protein